jgi:hypothetical protein
MRLSKERKNDLRVVWMYVGSLVAFVVLVLGSGGKFDESTSLIMRVTAVALYCSVLPFWVKGK